MRFPDELFDNFEVSVFRLETLSQYLVDQDIERIAAWKEGKLLPERSIRTSPWLRRISETTRLGKIWSRVHVIDQPLTDYLRFEIASYAQNVSAGEEVRIADRAMSPELDCLRKDFWMLDSETENALVILMDYDADGRFEGWEISKEESVIQRCRKERDFAFAYSVPLNEFQVLAASE